MIHNYIDDTGADYAVGDNGEGAVLLQVQDAHGVQARIVLTPKQARDAGCLLLEFAREQRRLRRQEETDFANAGAAYSDAEGGL